MCGHFPSFRVPASAMLDSGWSDAIARCADEFSSWSKLDGSSVTSRETDFGEIGAFEVGVVPGDVVAREVPWLMDLYRGPILDAVNALGLGRYRTAEDVRSTVNINSIPPGSRYEWHVDSNPMTALLFVTTHVRGTGGELVFRPDPRLSPDEAWEHVVHPESGELLVFDARESAHGVMPVGGGEVRITVPMNYYFADGAVSRPADLDAYLYGAADR
jgi:hypothetical protein